MELRWIASSSASCLHASAALIEGRRLIDARVAEELEQPTVTFAAQCAPLLAEGLLSSHLIALAGGIQNNRELATVALTKAVGRERAGPAVESLARNLTNLEAAFDRAKPDSIAELEHRFRPIQEQWEARGPGLLAHIAQMIEPGMLVERADIVLVHPAVGGDARAFPPYNVVVLEAILANPHADLSEVVRLAWALSQLNLDLPRFTERISSSRRAAVTALAMVPAALAAAGHVELSSCDAAMIAFAINAWRVRHSFTGDVPTTLWTWWQTYLESRPNWPVALAALDEMLAA
jgi:hypothetical protein